MNFLLTSPFKSLLPARTASICLTTALAAVFCFRTLAADRVWNADFSSNPISAATSNFPSGYNYITSGKQYHVSIPGADFHNPEEADTDPVVWTITPEAFPGTYQNELGFYYEKLSPQGFFFGGQGAGVQSVNFSTAAFAGKTIKEITVRTQLVGQQIDYTSCLYIDCRFGSVVQDSPLIANNMFSVYDTSATVYPRAGETPGEVCTGELQFTLTQNNLFFSQDKAPEFVVTGITVIYSDAADDPAPSVERKAFLPPSYSSQWSATGLVITADGEPLITGMNPEEITVTVEPLFEPVYAPEGTTSPAGSDSHYRDGETFLEITDDYTYVLHTPCSGRYRVTLAYADNDGITQTISHDYNVYPNIDGLTLNWSEVFPDGVTGVPSGLEADHEAQPRTWDNAILNLDASLLRVWYQVDKSDISTAAVAAALGEYPEIPEDFTLYGPKGIDLNGGHTLNFHLEKNGAVSRMYSIMYGRPGDDGVKTSAPGIDACADAAAEYYDLNGHRVNGDRLSRGIYVARRGSSSLKVIVK